MTLSGCTTASDLIDCTTSRQILASETNITATYSGSGGIQDLASNLLPAFTAQAVTNSSAQQIVVLSALAPINGTRYRRTVTQATLSLSTNKDATCRYGNLPGLAWSALTPHATTGVRSHTSTLSITAGQAYQRCSRCFDTLAQQYSSDACTYFSVQANRQWPW